MITKLLGCSARLWLMGAAVASVFAVTASGAGAEIPPAPLGLDRDGTKYALIANNRWLVSENNGGFVRAKAVIPISAGNPNSTSAFDRQDRAYIWAGRCTASRQVLVFRRNYFLPGPPKTFGASFDNSTFFGPPSNQAISQTSLVINGKVALTVNGGRWTINPGVRYTRLFKYGTNTVEFRVTKRVRQGTTTLGQCRYGSNPTRPLGITFALNGDFESDLWLSNDSSVTPVSYERRDPGNLGLEVFVRPRNLGLSGAYRGGLTIFFTSVNGPSAVVQNSVRVQGEGIRNCEITNFLSPSRIDCEVYRFRPGATPVVRFIQTIELVPGYTQVYTTASATIYSLTRDPSLQTNGWSRSRVFCGPNATASQCPPP